jgi:hypothetical protein
MRIPFTIALTAAAALGQVSASPLRVIIVSSTTEITTGTNRNMRLDHGIPNISSPVATLAKPAGPGGKIRRPCHAPLRAKTMELSNAFRKMFGFPLIHATDSTKAPSKEGEDRYQILPFIGTPPVVADVKGDHRHNHHHHHKGGPNHRMEQASFFERIHIALSALGPWEGKAVAFVIGCGIGVLLRMFWVLSVVFYRMIRGTKEEENKYTQIIVVEEYDDAEQPSAAPPTYTFADDKVDVKVATADAPEQTK